MRDFDPRRDPNQPEAAEPDNNSRDLRLRVMLHRRNLQRKARGETIAPNAGAAVDQASKSSGNALPAPLQRQFERKLGTDLSAVRVHTGAESAQANQAVGARAYTTGQHIHMGAGEYDPTTKGGQELLAHEVVHTVQQAGRGEDLQCKDPKGKDADHEETEADAKAAQMVAGTAKDKDGRVDTGHSARGRRMYPTDQGRLMIDYNSSMNPDDHPVEQKLESTTTAAIQAHTPLVAVWGNTRSWLAGHEKAEKLEHDDVKEQVAANTNKDVFGAAQDMANSSSTQELKDFIQNDLLNRLGDAGQTLAAAEKTLKSAKDRKAAEELQERIDDKREKIAKLNEGADIAFESIEAIGEENPIAAAKAVYKLASLVGTTLGVDPEEEEAKEQLKRSSDEQVQAAQQTYEAAQSALKHTRESFEGSGKLHDIAENYQRQQQYAEGEFDATTSGSFKFGPVAEQITWAGSAIQSLQAAQPTFDKALAATSDMQTALIRAKLRYDTGPSGVKGIAFPELDEGMDTADKMAAAQKKMSDTIASDLKRVEGLLAVFSKMRQDGDQAMVTTQPKHDTKKHVSKHSGGH